MDATLLVIAVLCVLVFLMFGYLVMDKKGNKTTGNKKKEKHQYSKLIVGLVIVLNVLFTIAVLYVFLQTGSEPTVLVGCWFAFTTGELWLLASIKKSKVKKEKDINGVDI